MDRIGTDHIGHRLVDNLGDQQGILPQMGRRWVINAKIGFGRMLAKHLILFYLVLFILKVLF